MAYYNTNLHYCYESRDVQLYPQTERPPKVAPGRNDPVPCTLVCSRFCAGSLKCTPERSNTSRRAARASPLRRASRTFSKMFSGPVSLKRPTGYFFHGPAPGKPVRSEISLTYHRQIPGGSSNRGKTRQNRGMPFL
jgi:hypothetical protein